MAQLDIHFRRSAFTFVELMIGMVVTTIVLGALAVFTFGVSDNWLQSDSTQSAYLRESMAVERLIHLVRQAQEIEPNPTTGSLDSSTPSAACMIWTDSNADGNIQYSELSMLQYLPDSQTIVQWSLPAAGAIYTPTADSPLMPEQQFSQLPGLTSTIIADNVAGCQFFSIPGSAASPMQRPSMEVVLKIKSDNPSVSSQVVYSTIALRAPLLNAQPSP